MFVFVQQEKGVQSQDDADLRKVVRSHVMRDFRRKQREAQGKEDSDDQEYENENKNQSRIHRKKKSRTQSSSNGYTHQTSFQCSVNADNTSSGKEIERTDTPLATTAHFDLRPLRRMQIFSHFFESHLPSASAAEIRRARYISFLSHIPYLTNPSPLLRNAVDAVCFAHVGIHKRDRQLLHASHDSYGRVLSRIRTMVSNPGMHHDLTPTEVIVSIMLAGLFDEAMPWYHRTSDSSYMIHIWGAQQYLGACDPKDFDLTQPLDRSAVHHVFQASYWLGIARREALSFRTPSWKKAELAIWPNRKWYHTYELIPGLLQKTDALLDNPDQYNHRDIIDLCRDFFQVHESIKMRRQPELNEYPPEMIKLNDYAKFDIDIEEHRFITMDTTFEQFSSFRNPELGVNSASLDILFLLLDCTFLRILHFLPEAREAIVHTIGRTTEQVEQDAKVSASQLCQDAHYFSALESEAYADFLKLMIRCARNFFEEQNMQRKKRWCEGCLSATDVRIKRIRTKRPPTLCRVSGLDPGLENASRFRTRLVSGGKEVSTKARVCPLRSTQSDISSTSMQDMRACPYNFT